jgi:transposase-like protein
MSKGKGMVSTEVAGVDNLSARRDDRAGAAAAAGPDPEVVAKATRRRFSAEYKLRILREAESQRELGATGAVLRREGLYSTHLSAWRRERDRGALDALGRRRRGRQPDPSQNWRQRIVELETERDRLQERLRQAEAIITAQKKLAEIFGPPGPRDERP